MALFSLAGRNSATFHRRRRSRTRWSSWSTAAWSAS